MAEVCVISAFMTNILLKKKQYGIFIAYGFTLWNIAAEIGTEILIIASSAGVLSWGVKLAGLKASDDMFKNILLAVHARFTLPVCVAVVFAVTAVSALLTSVKILKYRPAQLMGGTNGGN